ncbi:MAG: hypothetical protein PHO37_16625 [Kiritimatiellae bacterium]|nr:hypothetical protein [Kiritimatiellia bacterium]
MPNILKTTLVVYLAIVATGLQAAPNVFYCQAEDAELNQERIEVVNQTSFKSGRGVALKTGQAAAMPGSGAKPDLVFSIGELDPGVYALNTFAAVDSEGAKLMSKATSKHQSLFAYVQVNESLPTKRVIFVPWKDFDMCSQSLGIFDLKNKAALIKLWLPVHVRLDRLEVHKYNAPKVPDAAVNYSPAVTPLLSHPRLWVSESTLPRIRTNLKHPEHATLWGAIQKLAAKKVEVEFPENVEMEYNTALEKGAAAKAFVYLMTGDQANGREAVRLMREYISRVSFGNVLDITREMGAAIYTTALVYDWCHPLCTPHDLEIFRTHMLRLASEMECQWPPFRTSVVNGHGNEAMINRDLLSMAIALYNVDPEPYKFCSYRLLEELVPQRRFEYQSPRHNQGVNYASYRFGWEMQAAWLLRRLSGRELFDPNIKSVPQYWLNMRLPNGQMLRDGDGIPGGRYYSYAQTAMLCYTYSNDPVLKGEFQRQSIKSVDPMLFLLLNDPALRAEPDLNKLPLTIDFGAILSGMITRTSWNITSNIGNTVVAEIKGGGYHFGNHQHADAGALQLYYRGLQIVDLGQYVFYGTPFDMNFNKRSIAHSMLLVIDPEEKFLNTLSNDGGSRFLQSHPRSPRQTKENPLFHYGRKISCGFGPSPMRPSYSYYAADLSSAYSKKIKSFTRAYCFLNMNSATHPACVITLDNVNASDPAFKKYWQVNTLQPPQQTEAGVQLHNFENNVTGRVDICMLRPAPGEWTCEIKSGAEAFNVFGYQVTPPSDRYAESKGHRVLFSPKKPSAHDTFLTLMQLHEDGAAPLPYTLIESESQMTITIADRVVCMARDGRLISKSFEISVPSDGQSYQVVLTGLLDGDWQITTEQSPQTYQCGKNNNTLFFTARGGKYQVVAPGDAAVGH